MDKKRLELIAGVVLVLVFIFILSMSLARFKLKTPSSIKKEASVQTAAGLKTKPSFKAKKEKGHEEKKGLPWGRDPFVLEESVQGAEGTIGNLRLMGITVGDKTKSMAIINDEIASVGSKIGKFTVLKIYQDLVVVTDGENNYDLKMKRQ